jgi:pantoate--beta-alanine ligase
VATVVLKLLQQVRPDVLLLGQKDGQQAIIVHRMMIDLDLHRAVRLLVCPTVREPDGLAMSSRNRYLSAAERRQAPSLYRALLAGVELISAGERRSAVVRRRVLAELASAPLARVEYVRLVDTANLLAHDRLPPEVMIAVAARFGRARLIDNVVVRFKGFSGAS